MNQLEELYKELQDINKKEQFAELLEDLPPNLNDPSLLSTRINEILELMGKRYLELETQIKQAETGKELLAKAKAEKALLYSKQIRDLNIEKELRAAQAKLTRADSKIAMLNSEISKIKKNLIEVETKIEKLKNLPPKPVSRANLATDLARELEFAKNLKLKLNLVLCMLKQTGISFEEVFEEEDLLETVLEAENESAIFEQLIENQKVIEALEARLHNKMLRDE